MIGEHQFPKTRRPPTRVDGMGRENNTIPTQGNYPWAHRIPIRTGNKRIPSPRSFLQGEEREEGEEGKWYKPFLQRDGTPLPPTSWADPHHGYSCPNTTIRRTTRQGWTLGPSH